MGKLRWCKRCNQLVSSKKFRTTRKTKRYGEMVGGKKLLKTCSDCRVKKNASSRATYTENNTGVSSRGPQKDLVWSRFFSSLQELKENLRLARSEEFRDDFDWTEFL